MVRAKRIHAPLIYCRLCNAPSLSGARSRYKQKKATNKKKTKNRTHGALLSHWGFALIISSDATWWRWKGSWRAWRPTSCRSTKRTRNADSRPILAAPWSPSGSLTRPWLFWIKDAWCDSIARRRTWRGRCATKILPWFACIYTYIISIAISNKNLYS